MNREEILSAIQTLAMSQGFWERVLQNLIDMQENDPDEYEGIMRRLEEKQFADTVDMVLYFES